MSARAFQATVIFVFLLRLASAQVMSIPTTGFGGIGTDQTGAAFGVSLGAISAEQMTNNLWAITRNGNQDNASPLQSSSGSVSKLDLKAPAKARKEYTKGYRLLQQKNFKEAAEPLRAAIDVYKEFVAAHNALGSVYLGLGENEKARDEFALAVALDDHLPNSFLNLSCAQLALKQNTAAEESAKKAASLAPLDLQLAVALSYVEFVNRDFAGVLETAKQVHSRKHKGAGIVHYFAAAAWDGQNKLPEAQHELEILLQEEPKSPAADEARKILAQLRISQIVQSASVRQAAKPQAQVEVDPAVPPAPTEEELAKQRQLLSQQAAESKQIEEAEKMGDACTGCSVAIYPGQPDSTANGATNAANTPYALRSVVEEVAVFFAATDHGKPVTDLTREDVGLRDDKQSPAAITGFHNEAELPLRLGIVIDTSESVTSRFAFEQHAAMAFAKSVVTGKDDLAFVVGVSNSVLLVQDFTNKEPAIAHGIDQLAPGGGTALWDAVGFAADKLTRLPENRPVARMLVVISDGSDNSSTLTLKEAIEASVRGEVFVYTVSTRDTTNFNSNSAEDREVGERALKVLAGLTGGADFEAGSITGLDRSLEELQQVIRSRYLISYKPATFKHNGQYRPIEITAQKSGRKLRVYARRGYYDRLPSSTSN